MLCLKRKKLNYMGSNWSKICPLLEKAGVPVGSMYGGIDICTNCPISPCTLDPKKPTHSPFQSSHTRDVYVQCPNCYCLEELTFRSDLLTGNYDAYNGIIKSGNWIQHTMSRELYHKPCENVNEVRFTKENKG